MKIHVNKVIRNVLIATLCLGTFSCKDTFDLAPKNSLELSQVYQNVFDADAAVFGLYGKFIRLTDRYLVLNELRADLEDVTPQSDRYLRELNENNVTDSNPWSNPKPFYELVIDCNDVLKNFDIMIAQKKMSQTEYNLRFSEVGALRTWTYLQLGIHFGSIPYITDALESVEAVQDQTKFPKITFDQLIDKLIAFMESLPNKNFISTSTNSLNTTIDGYSTTRIFVNKDMLFGQLYLWKGNYSSAAHYFRNMLEYGESILSKPLDTDWYGVNINGNNGGTSTQQGNWSLIFTNDIGERYINYEQMWALPFDKSFAPSNPLIPLFSPGSDKYQIRPSQLAINNWNNENRTGPEAGDIYRGGGNKSWGGTAAAPYCYKLVPGFNPASPFETKGKIIMYRTGELHLEFSEAANRDTRDKLAYAFLNNGLKTTYTPIPLPTNVTNIMQSFDQNPDYYFDARFGDNPNYRRKWGYNVGLRSRASLVAAKVDSTKFFDMSNRGSQTKPVTDRAGLTIAMEDLLVNENALELAFEGSRWPTLVRIALRREKENPGSGKLFLRNKIAAKFIAAGKPVPANIEKLGADINSWYLPFKF